MPHEMHGAHEVRGAWCALGSMERKVAVQQCPVCMPAAAMVACWLEAALQACVGVRAPSHKWAQAQAPAPDGFTQHVCSNQAEGVISTAHLLITVGLLAQLLRQRDIPTAHTCTYMHACSHAVRRDEWQGVAGCAGLHPAPHHPQRGVGEQLGPAHASGRSVGPPHSLHHTQLVSGVWEGAGRERWGLRVWGQGLSEAPHASLACSHNIAQHLCVGFLFSTEEGPDWLLPPACLSLSQAPLTPLLLLTAPHCFLSTTPRPSRPTRCCPPSPGRPRYTATCCA